MPSLGPCCDEEGRRTDEEPALREFTIVGKQKGNRSRAMFPESPVCEVTRKGAGLTPTLQEAVVWESAGDEEHTHVLPSDNEWHHISSHSARDC